MSVILDALRRARQGRASAPPSSPVPPSHVAPRMPAGVPVALRTSAKPRPKAKAPSPRILGLVAGLVIIGATVWAGLQFWPLLMRRQVTAVTNTSRPVEPLLPAAEKPANAGPPSLTEMIDRIQQPPAIAPRAMDPTPAAATPARPAARAATAPPPPRLLPAEPVRPLTMPAVTAVAPAPLVNHFELAVRYQSLGNFEQALKHYLALLEIDEFNAEARNNLGLLYHQRGLVPESVDQFRRAILINPQYLKARSNLAVVLMNAGRLAEARAELRAAQTIDPRNADLTVNMALVEKADRMPQLAQELLLKAIGLQPTHAVAHYNLGLLYEEAGEKARAADEYQQFLKYAGPEHGALLSDVGRKIDVLMPRALPR